MKVGIIGTGLLGSAVATRIASAGHTTIIYNRTKKKASRLEKKGVRIADSPRDVAASSDLVIIIVKDANAVDSVSFGKGGIIEGIHRGLVVADMSTISPISSIKISKKFKNLGVAMLDTPVMGGPSLAEKGMLVVMVGGDKAAYKKCKNVFDVIGEKTFYLGSSGSADAMKLAMNLQISILALALSEGIILAKKAGLDPHLFLEVLNSTHFKTGMSLLKGPKMVNGVFEPSFYLSVMQKDLGEINYTARQYGANLPMAKLANRIYQQAVKAGLGSIDYTGILAYLEKLSKSES